MVCRIEIDDDKENYSTPVKLSLARPDSLTAQHGKKFVGLENQGATCYMNSTLQYLFMTPEFRSEVLRWAYNSECNPQRNMCVAFQLQRLFALLQGRREFSAISTYDLTESYQHSKALKNFNFRSQQDMQEFLALILDALEEDIKGSAQDAAIKNLITGNIVNYIKCINIAYESTTNESFNHLSLPIPAPSNVFATIQLSDCIEKFLTPEVLDGANQYHAENVPTPQDAIKGCRIESLPRVLNIHLKRFVHNGNIQTKDNSIVAFPMLLNMNKYISGNNNSNRGESVNTHIDNFVARELASIVNKRNGQFQSSHIEDNEIYRGMPDLVDSNMNLCPEQLQEELSDINKRYLRTCPSQEVMRNLVHEFGEYIYELVGVIVHFGQLESGHYYTYLKDVMSEDRQWYEFNDAMVTVRHESEVTKFWGETNKCENAYMLMYRKVSTDCDLAALSVPSGDDLSEYLRDVVSQYDHFDRNHMNHNDIMLTDMTYSQEHTKHLTIYYSADNVFSEPSKNYIQLRDVLSGFTVADVLRQLWMELTLYKSPQFADMAEQLRNADDSTIRSLAPLDRMRLRRNKAFEKSERIKLENDFPIVYSDFDLYLETRWPNEPWWDCDVNDMGDVEVLIYLYYPPLNQFLGPKEVTIVNNYSSKSELRQEILSKVPGGPSMVTWAVQDTKMYFLPYYEKCRLSEDIYCSDRMRIFIEQPNDVLEPGKALLMQYLNKFDLSIHYHSGDVGSGTICLTISALRTWKVSDLKSQIKSQLSLNFDENQLVLRTKCDEYELTNDHYELTSTYYFPNNAVIEAWPRDQYQRTMHSVRWFRVSHFGWKDHEACQRIRVISRDNGWEGVGLSSALEIQAMRASYDNSNNNNNNNNSKMKAVNGEVGSHMGSNLDDRDANNEYDEEKEFENNNINNNSSEFGKRRRTVERPTVFADEFPPLMIKTEMPSLKTSFPKDSFTIDDIRRSLWSELVQQGLISSDSKPSNVRIYIPNAFKSPSIYINGVVEKALGVYDNSVLFEIIDIQEHLPDFSRHFQLIPIRFWDQSQWTIGPTVLFLVENNVLVSTLIDIVSREFNIANNKLEYYMQRSISTFRFDSLSKYIWKDIYSTNAKDVIADCFCMSNDDGVLIRDKEQLYVDPQFVYSHSYR